jgi:hypothetical protein
MELAHGIPFGFKTKGETPQCEFCPKQIFQVRAPTRRLDCFDRREDRLFSHFLKEDWLSPDGLPANKPSTLMSSSISSQ